MKYDVGDELINSKEKTLTIVGYVYWKGHLRYYCLLDGGTIDLTIEHLSVFGFKRVK